MTGDRFREIREELGLSLRDLAKRWDIDKMKIHREEKKRKIRRLYRDAILRVQRLHGGAEREKEDREKEDKEKTDDEDDERRGTGSAPLPRSQR